MLNITFVTDMNTELKDLEDYSICPITLKESILFDTVTTSIKKINPDNIKNEPSSLFKKAKRYYKIENLAEITFEEIMFDTNIYYTHPNYNTVRIRDYCGSIKIYIPNMTDKGITEYIPIGHIDGIWNAIARFIYHRLYKQLDKIKNKNKILQEEIETVAIQRFYKGAK